MTDVKLKKYYEEGSLAIRSIPFNHIIPRVARSSGSNVCRISLPKILDGKRVYVIVNLTDDTTGGNDENNTGIIQ